MVGQYKLDHLCEYGEQNGDFEVFVGFNGIVIVVIWIPEFIGVYGQPYEGVYD